MTSSITQLIDEIDKNLPSKTVATLNQIKDLDTEVAKTDEELKLSIYKYVKSLKKVGRDAKKRSYKAILAQFEHVRALNEKKIKLAEGMYGDVDSYITQMDQEFNKFHEARMRNENDVKREEPNDKNEKKSEKDKKRKSQSAAQQNKANRMKEHASMLDTFQQSPISNNLEMPVDPNEPVYCTCHQVSFGSMVACDNEDCPTEWFHFSCVGLTATPTGKWYCSQCTQSMAAQKKKKN